MNEQRPSRPIRHARPWSVGPLAVGLSVLILAGCASTPEPVAEMATARAAVSAVEDTDVQRLAPVQRDCALRAGLDAAQVLAAVHRSALSAGGHRCSPRARDAG